MDSPMSWKEFSDSLSTFILKEDKKKLLIDIQADSIKLGPEKVTFAKEDFENLWNASVSFDEDTLVMYDKKHIEVFIKVETPRMPQRYIVDRLTGEELYNGDMGIRYSFHKASLQSMICILSKIMKKSMPLNHVQFLGILRESDSGGITMDELLFSILRFPYILLVASDSEISKKELLELCHSFMFTCSFNIGIAFRRITDIDDMYYNYVPLRKNNRRIKSIVDLPLPLRSYLSELIDQYNMGLAADDPFIEFLCFFHIIEHFFDEVYRDEFINIVQLEITSPRFSSRRKKDINKLIEMMRKRWNVGTNEFRQDEEEALVLTLKKFVRSLENLKNDISDFDKSSVSYYQTQQVSFSKGEKIDFGDCSSEKVYAQIASRIYQTRNAIVHNKANDLRDKARGIYRPFSDKKELAKEIPLIRIIAETIIINSSILL